MLEMLRIETSDNKYATKAIKQAAPIHKMVKFHIVTHELLFGCIQAYKDGQQTASNTKTDRATCDSEK